MVFVQEQMMVKNMDVSLSNLASRSKYLWQISIVLIASIIWGIWIIWIGGFTVATHYHDARIWYPDLMTNRSGSTIFTIFLFVLITAGFSLILLPLMLRGNSLLKASSTFVPWLSNIFRPKSTAIVQDEYSQRDLKGQIRPELPERQSREDILKDQAKELNIGHDVNLPLIARSTMGFSDANLAALCQQAQEIADESGHAKVCMVDFEKALDQILLAAPPGLLASEIEQEIAAYHEAGHALAAWLTPQADPINSISLLRPDLSHSEFNNLETRVLKHESRARLLARLKVILGGRAAEEVVFDDVTASAENDLAAATQLVCLMVTRWGMGRIGLMRISNTGYGHELVGEGKILPPFSEETASRVDREIERILEEYYQIVLKMLNKSREELDTLAGFLLQEEHIEREMLADLLGDRKI